MNKKYLLGLISLLLFLLATGCTNYCETNQYTYFQMYQDEPINGAVINDLSPHFGWHHSEECDPKYVRLTLSRKTIQGNDIHYRPGSSTGWTLNYDLEPGGEYNWSVAPYRTEGGLEGPETEKWTFFTGPVCTGNETLQAPVLKSPFDGEWITTNHPFKFQWVYPGNCLPNGYAYQFASDPQFSYPLSSGITSGYEQHVSIPSNFPDCSTIYWRVAAKIGSNIGPYSTVGSFTKVANKDCWQMNVLSPTLSLLRGEVFLDKCGWTSWLTPLGPYSIPAECVITGGIGISANGIHEYGEEKLRGVVVDLGAGPCPSTGLDQDITDHNGYNFIVQLPGTYCITVSKDQPGTPHVGGHNYDFHDGLWTYPITKDLLAQETVVLQEGINLLNLNIGWDEYDQLFKNFVVTKQSNCRAGPTRYDFIVANVNAGDTIPIVARNEEATWFVGIVNGVECLISTASGTPPEDVEELGIFEPFPPPPPTPTPQRTGGFSCSEYKTESTCRADSRCDWPVGIGASYCVNK